MMEVGEQQAGTKFRNRRERKQSKKLDREKNKKGVTEFKTEESSKNWVVNNVKTAENLETMKVLFIDHLHMFFFFYIVC